jgi:hypothetical protein
MVDPFKGKNRYGTVKEVPEHLVLAIETPHDHEGKGNRPLWIIWKQYVGRNGAVSGPQIDTVCDTLRSAYYMLLEENARRTLHLPVIINVERIPANHRFASSIGEVFTDNTLTKVKMPATKFTYAHDGD